MLFSEKEENNFSLGRHALSKRGLKRGGVLEESREGTYRITGFADSIKRKTVNWRGKGEARIGGSCHVVNLLARRHLCVPTAAESEA